MSCFGCEILHAAGMSTPELRITLCAGRIKYDDLFSTLNFEFVLLEQDFETSLLPVIPIDFDFGL
jgi:hypothetical protein